MAKPLVTALVVLPTASRLTMIRSGSPWNSPDISAMPAALSADRAEGVLGDDDAGGGQHAHAGEGDEVEGEREVAAAEAERAPMARAMATMAYTNVEPHDGPASTMVAGPVSVALALSWNCGWSRCRCSTR